LKSVDDVLRTVSECLKDLFYYELFGFAMKYGDHYDLWVDPSVYEDKIRSLARKAYPGQKNDFYVHHIGFSSNPNRQMNDSLLLENIISYPIMHDTFEATLYILPRRRVLFQNDYMRIIVRSLGIALENALRIQRLENAAVVDPLTNCFNRRAFQKYLENSIASAMRYQHSLSLIMMDLDDFKKINDAHGHETGDRVLKTVSELVASSVRKSDFLARYGGEEFVLVLPQTGLFYATQIAEKLRKNIARLASDAGGRTISITASFGVATLRKEMDSAALLHEADQMLYAAKYHGKNVVAPWNAMTPLTIPRVPGPPLLQY
jgi:diguanylate cyclase (GGDEF)-like protein